MAIKDQCDNCKNFSTNNHCTIYDYIIDYNGKPCDKFEAKTKINLDKNTKSPEINELILEKDEAIIIRPEIQGWLSFFLFSISLGGVLTLIQAFTSFKVSNYEIGCGEFMTYFGIFTDALFTLGMLVSCGYTLNSFLNFKNYSVGIGKLYLIILFYSNILALYGGVMSGFDETSFWGSSIQVVRGLIWCIVWFLYLLYSKQVNEIFPKQNRTVLKRDKIIFGTLILLPILYFLSIYLFVFFKNVNDQNKISSEIKLNYGEYSDGKIVFRKPIELEIKKEQNNNLIFYSLSMDSTISVVIMSDYDRNYTDDNFNNYFNSFKSERFNDFKSKIIVEDHNNINNKMIYVKRNQYETTPLVTWTFSAIFDINSGKVAIVSYYNYEYEGRIPIDLSSDIIKSIHFK